MTDNRSDRFTDRNGRRRILRGIWRSVVVPAPLLVTLAIFFSAPASIFAAVGPETTPFVAADYHQVHHVAPTGSDDSGDGSRTRPWATISHALATVADAAQEQRHAILIAEGAYAGRAIQMKPHVDLFGGFVPGDWSRDIAAHPTILDAAEADRVILGAADARLDGFVIRNGKVKGPGGAILCDHTSPRITNNLIEENKTLEPDDYIHTLLHQIGHDGGAIACINGASPIIENNIIVNNQTGVGNGGGIACRNYGEATIAHNVIVNNTTGATDVNRSRSSNGGGISAVNAKPRIEDNVVLNNRVDGNSDAGGIYCEYDASAQIIANIIVGNLAEDDGGGIYVMKSSEPLIDSNIIAGNQGGGAIRLSKEGRARIFNNIVFGNTTGDINCIDSWMILANNTIADNIGRGISYENRTPHLRASTIVNNIFFANNKWTLRIHGSGEQPVIAHCLVQGGQAGPDNIDGDPHFVDDAVRGEATSVRYDPAQLQTTLALISQIPKDAKLAGRVVKVGDKWSVIKTAQGREIIVWGQLALHGPAQYEITRTYRLQPDSPCIDRGVPVDGVVRDAIGNTRPAHSRFDIGAVEFSQDKQ